LPFARSLLTDQPHPAIIDRPTGLNLAVDQERFEMQVLQANVPDFSVVADIPRAAGAEAASLHAETIACS
jgi:hypothetical protein